MPPTLASRHWSQVEAGQAFVLTLEYALVGLQPNPSTVEDG
jgi:hypothetical protein